MATPSAKAEQYEKDAKAMDWPAVANLWDAVKAGATPGWDAGKALEYLVVRGFELSTLVVEYPFDVPPGGSPIEQIDGLVMSANWSSCSSARTKTNPMSRQSRKLDTSLCAVRRQPSRVFLSQVSSPHQR